MRSAPHGGCLGLMVVPTYNEHQNLGDLVPLFFSHNRDFDLLIVDDASPDGTAELARQLQTGFPRLHLLERSGPRGLGRAYLAGLQRGLREGYPFIGTMDADLSHDPAALREMLAVAAHHDVVIGSRYIKDGGTVNWGLRRILLSWLANRFAARLLGIGAHDLTSGYRLYRAQTLRRLPLEQITSTGYSFLVEMLHLLARAGASIAEVPIIFTDRSMGESKLGGREIYLGAYHLLAMRLRNRSRAN